MTRIIAGAAGGRRLRVPPKGTRPTSDRVREALFSALDSDLSAHDLAWTQIAVLDLYAGSGALGLEALSRGARSVVLVEKSPVAGSVLRENVASVGLPGARIIPRDVASVGAPESAADLVLADPPYDVGAATVREVLEALHVAGWIAAGARVVVERATRDEESPLPEGWLLVRQRAYGETSLWYGRVVE